MSHQLSNRGRVWFNGLTGAATAMPGDPDSVLTADGRLGEESARFLCVVLGASCGGVISLTLVRT